MDWRDVALALAGVIGSAVAVVHGIILQRLGVRPIARLLLTEERITAPVRRLMPPLLHFSTISWFFGGLALIAAALWFGESARLATGLFVGSHFLFGAGVNLWATRGRHPGWMLLAAAIILIAVGVDRPGG
jgi:hypothetical protein